MTNSEAIDVIKQVAGHVSGGDVYEGYSGRGMYGAECWGISCDDDAECIEAAAEYGLKGAKTDSLGKGYIVYWPKVKYETEPAA